MSLCQVYMLRERNKCYGTIKFVDISSDDYSLEENQGLDYKTVRSKQYWNFQYTQFAGLRGSCKIRSWKWSMCESNTTC